MRQSAASPPRNPYAAQPRRPRILGIVIDSPEDSRIATVLLPIECLLAQTQPTTPTPTDRSPLPAYSSPAPLCDYLCFPNSPQVSPTIAMHILPHLGKWYSTGSRTGQGHNVWVGGGDGGGGPYYFSALTVKAAGDKGKAGPASHTVVRRTQGNQAVSTSTIPLCAGLMTNWRCWEGEEVT